jgi:predicted alpha/beta hydrolase family esterase
MKAVILPGNGNATPSMAWYQSVQSQLQAMGYEVVLETMPDPELARASYRLPWLESKTQWVSDVILIGHSSWAEAILRYLEQYKASIAVLIWAQYTDLGIDTEQQSGYYDKARNWSQIKANVGTIIQFASIDDPYIPIEEARMIRDQLDTEYYEFPRKGHFMDEEFPELIQVLKSKMSLTSHMWDSISPYIPKSISTDVQQSPSSSDWPNMDIPVAVPQFQDDDEVHPPVRSHFSILTWILPVAVLGLLGRLLYQNYFQSSSDLTVKTNTPLDTALQWNPEIQTWQNDDSQEDSLDAFLAEEWTSTLSASWSMWIVSGWAAVSENSLATTANTVSIIPDLSIGEDDTTIDETIQVVPISPEEIAKIQKQHLDTKKISQTALDGDKKLRKNFGIGEMFVEFVSSPDHQQDRILLSQNGQTQTFAAGYLWQGSNCYANKVGIFWVKSEFLVYPTNCKDVYVFDTLIKKNFVKQGQIVYFHNKQIIIGLKSVDGWTDLYAYDYQGWRQLVTSTIITIRTDNRGVYLIAKDSVTVLDIANLNQVTTIPLKWMKVRTVLKDDSFLYMVVEKPEWGMIVQKYNLLNGTMVGSAIASNFQL